MQYSNTVLKCSIQVQYSNAVLKHSIQVQYLNAVSKSSIEMQYSNTVSWCVIWLSSSISHTALFVWTPQPCIPCVHNYLITSTLCITSRYCITFLKRGEKHRIFWRSSWRSFARSFPRIFFKVVCRVIPIRDCEVLKVVLWENYNVVWKIIFVLFKSVSRNKGCHYTIKKAC